MKGGNRTWLVLVALAVIVAMAYYLLEVRKVAEKPEKAKYVWDFGENEITAIQVTALLSGTVKVEKRAGEWWVTQPVTGVAQASTCDSLAYALAHLVVRRTITENPTGEDLQTYGLSTPSYEITVWWGSRTAQLAVGAHHPGGAYYVQRLADGPGAVLMVPDYALKEVLGILETPPLMEATPAP